MTALLPPSAPPRAPPGRQPGGAPTGPTVTLADAATRSRLHPTGGAPGGRVGLDQAPSAPVYSGAEPAGPDRTEQEAWTRHLPPHPQCRVSLVYWHAGAGWLNMRITG